MPDKTPQEELKVAFDHALCLIDVHATYYVINLSGVRCREEAFRGRLQGDTRLLKKLTSIAAHTYSWRINYR